MDELIQISDRGDMSTFGNINNVDDKHNKYRYINNESLDIVRTSLLISLIKGIHYSSSFPALDKDTVKKYLKKYSNLPNAVDYSDEEFIEAIKNVYTNITGDNPYFKINNGTLELMYDYRISRMYPNKNKSSIDYDYIYSIGYKEVDIISFICSSEVKNKTLLSYAMKQAEYAQSYIGEVDYSYTVPLAVLNSGVLFKKYIYLLFNKIHAQVEKDREYLKYIKHIIETDNLNESLISIDEEVMSGLTISLKGIGKVMTRKIIDGSKKEIKDKYADLINKEITELVKKKRNELEKSYKVDSTLEELVYGQSFNMDVYDTPTNNSISINPIFSPMFNTRINN